jgi:dienelactone hydrolase
MITRGKRALKFLSTVEKRARYGYVAIVAFLLTQALDGALTCHGVSLHGVTVEANPLAARLMSSVGLIPAVAGLKLLTSTIGVTLYALGAHRALATMTAVYFVAAVLPWAGLLLFV